MVKNLLAVLLVFGSISIKGQSEKAPFENPKLVVGIVVDQMRYDYLTRFWDRYGDGGFKRMVNEGFNCKNNHFNYVPTYTGPGHASVHTGTTPSVHGVISNNFYDKRNDKMVYCAGDDRYNSVGSKTDAGKMSPHRMLTTTVADQNRLHTQMRGKTIGVAIKDRGSILPAGHSANAAYWFTGGDEGNWITSTYYMQELPDWVKKFNKKHSLEKYLDTWETLYDLKTYTASGADKNNFEGGFKGKESATFPYNLKKLSKENGNYGILRATPFGNSLTTDFALEALDKEELGMDSETDFLVVSYSSTDYVGHNFGVNSVEIEDTYLRLDKDLERIFKELDKKVGKGKYTVFLTADHGAVHVPSYLQSLKIPAGYYNNTDFRNRIKEFLKTKFGSEKLLINMSNNQLFLDHDLVDEMGLDEEKIQEALVRHILQYDFIHNAYSAENLMEGDFTEGLEVSLKNGYNQMRSGDVIYVMNPAVILYSRTGSTHGTGMTYDTHVPLLFFGQGINQGSTTHKTSITDIAPTISSLLGIAFPNGATGQPITKVID
ncbi:alkaline phosphatase PafA [Spongiivirga citrea]|uniref:Alkaline phosphatase family protein n=1 Tax=Spongiivirga citrea TaxID=1481457 RepID=A0A6M0CXA0_9FLAO|nr:alkaline phosphatase PafA [Spongiivirga citrea]NER18360.1 alkaline phosphatase family protein [Spongiivirga citrea]